MCVLRQSKARLCPFAAALAPASFYSHVLNRVTSSICKRACFLQGCGGNGWQKAWCSCCRCPLAFSWLLDDTGQGLFVFVCGCVCVCVCGFVCVSLINCIVCNNFYFPPGNKKKLDTLWEALQEAAAASNITLGRDVQVGLKLGW